MQHFKRTVACATLACLGVVTAAVPVQAKGYTASSYLGLDGSAINIESGVAEEVSPLGLRLRLGTRLSKNFDLEAQFGGGSDSAVDQFDKLGASYIGLYAKGYLPVGRFSALFALAGASAVELTETVNNREFSDERVGFSYGIGLETQLSNRLDLSADYMRYSLGSDDFSEVSAVNLGLKYYF